MRPITIALGKYCLSVVLVCEVAAETGKLMSYKYVSPARPVTRSRYLPLPYAVSEPALVQLLRVSSFEESSRGRGWCQRRLPAFGF